MREMAKTAFIVALGLLIVFALIIGAVIFVTLDLRDKPTGPTALEATTHALGTVPAASLAINSRGEWHSNGQVSLDEGLTWHTLTDAMGRRALVVGAERAIAPAVGPDGRVLYGEVLLDQDTSAGQGLFVHAVEWTGEAWKTLMQAPVWPPPEPAAERGITATQSRRPQTLAPPERIVRFLAYDAEGLSLVVTHTSLMRDGEELELPGPPSAFLAASDRSLYLGVNAVDKFGLYRCERSGAVWLPEPGIHSASALAELRGTVIVSTDAGVLRRTTAGWIATDPPASFPGQHLATTGELSPLLFVWGSGGLAVSLDAGRTLHTVALPAELSVIWVTSDPQRPDAVIVLDTNRRAHRVALAPDRASR